MNILYYIPSLGQHMGGINQYAYALLKILSKDTENNYFVLHEANDPDILEVINNSPRLRLLKINKPVKNVANIYADKIRRRLSVYFESLSARSREMAGLEKACKTHSIDIIHCPYQYLPETKLAKKICTMHDIQEIHFPEYFSPEDRAARAVNYLEYIKGADTIIVSYEHVRSDIIKYFNTAPEKIKVCLLEMDNLWIDRYNPDDVISLPSHGIQGDFIIYPANTWQHKNHQKLLEALLILKEQGHDNIKLICTGNKTAFFDEQLAPFIRTHNLAGQVTFTGILDDVSLYSLYKTCLGVVVPTIYEAGSFPLMEAILLGVPVICSNVTSLPETIGNNDFVFNPNDAADIADKILKLWCDETYRQKSVENSKNQSVRIRNTNALDIIKTIYSELNQ